MPKFENHCQTILKKTFLVISPFSMSGARGFQDFPPEPFPVCGQFCGFLHFIILYYSLIHILENESTEAQVMSLHRIVVYIQPILLCWILFQVHGSKVASCHCTWEGNRQRPRHWVLATHMRSSRPSSRFLDLAWPQTVCCGYLGHKLRNGRCLCPTL